MSALGIPSYASDMYYITIHLQYPWPPRTPEEEAVSFVLSGEYPASSPQEAEEVIRKLISVSEPGFVLDSKGTAWPFYRGTVREISAAKVS